MEHICEKCGRRFATGEVDRVVAVRMVSLWFANWPIHGSPIHVGKMFNVDKSQVKIMVPIESEFPRVQGDMHIFCYPDQVKAALIMLADAAMRHVRERLEYWTKAGDTVGKACEDVLEKMARGEIR